MGTDEKGNPQYILGNSGKNTRWDVDRDKPLILIADDFDNNQSIDPIMFSYLIDGHYPVEGRDKLISQVPSWKNRFLKYSEFAKYRLEDFFSIEQRENAIELRAYQLESAIMKKDESGKFMLHPLPKESQFAPIYGIYYDQKEEMVFTIGNFYGNESVTGRYDAAIGNVVAKDENGDFTKREKEILDAATKKESIRLEKILFKLGLSELQTASYQELDELVMILLKNKQLKILLEGHTDISGDAEDNFKLSIERVNTCRDYLIKYGVSPTRINTKGYGGTKPLVKMGSESERALNRRVEIKFVE